MASVTKKIKFVRDTLRIRPKGWQSLLWNSSMAQLGKVGPLMSPVHVSIEPTNACNARCPVCETGKGDMRRSSGFIDHKLFSDFLDQIHKSTSVLFFYFMGEPFMHPEIYRMIKIARSKNIYVETCTNGDFVDPEGVIYSDINKISFQIGGLDQETHSRYRIRSNLNKVLTNLEQLIRKRNQTPESSVEIDVGFIVMRHNEHQVEEFLSWAKGVGVDTANIIDPCARNMLEARAYLTENEKYWFYDREAFENGVLRPKIVPKNNCVWVWNSTQINWDGSVVPCCRDPNGKYIFGNVFEEPLTKIFNGEKSRAFRKQIISNQQNIDICQLCSGYGLPNLNPIRENDFHIRHHSINTGSISVKNV